jgi:nucleoside-diphosphate-sugar epimerase
MSGPHNAETPRTSRFLVTGAKGFIGAWVVKNLVDRGECPWVFDVDERAHRLAALLSRENLERIHHIRGDIRRVEEVDRAVGEHGITHIIHLAALQVPACAKDPILGAEVNVLGALNVFEAARRRKDTVRSVAYASSVAVFGPEELYQGIPGEDAPLHPRTHYGVFKQCNEGNASVYAESWGLSLCGLRPWAVYGVGRDQGLTSQPTQAIKALVMASPYTIHFTGALDLQYANDVARIFLQCADACLPGAHAYALRGAVVRVEDLITLLEKVRPGAARLVRAEGQPLPFPPELDDSALVRDLGQVPRTSLEAGIRGTLAIYERLQKEGRLDRAEL